MWKYIPRSIGLAATVLPILLDAAPPDIPLLVDVRLDWTVLAFGVAITLGTSLLDTKGTKGSTAKDTKGTKVLEAH